MPAISIGSSIMPDFDRFRSKTPSFSLPKSPKAAKRFFGFPTSPGEDSPPVPPLPSTSSHQHTASISSSTTSLATVTSGFQGATVVRTPQEALEGIKSLTPPVLPQLPIAHTYSTAGKKIPSYQSHSSSNSLDRGKYNAGTIQTSDGQHKIYRSQSATEELRSPIISGNVDSSPPTPATAPPPCRSGIIGIKGALKPPTYGYLQNNDSTADNWAREVLGSIRISTDMKYNNRSSITESKLGSIFGINNYKAESEHGGGDLNSFIESYGNKYNTFTQIQPSLVSTSSTQTFGHDDDHDNEQQGGVGKFKGYQPSIVSTTTSVATTTTQQQPQGYSEDQYRPYIQPNFSTGPESDSQSSMMLDEERYPPRSSSTLQHLEEVRFTPLPTSIPPSYSTSMSPSTARLTTTPEIEEEYEDTQYDPFKKINHYPSSSISTISDSTHSATTNIPTRKQSIDRIQRQQVQDKPIPFTTPTYPQANPVESTYSSLSSKPKTIEEEDKSLLLALPTRDFTRSPSQHSMNQPSPRSPNSDYSSIHDQGQAQNQVQAEESDQTHLQAHIQPQIQIQTSTRSSTRTRTHMRSPSTPSPLPSNSSGSFTSIQTKPVHTHSRSPSSPAEFSPSPLSPSPNTPIQKLRRPSLLSNRNSTVRPPPRSTSRQFTIQPQTQTQPQPQARSRVRESLNQTPFHATLLEDNIRSIPYDGNEGDIILLNFEFAYSLDEKPNNEKVIIPIEIIRNQGQSKLLDWIERYLSRDNNNNNNNKQNVISTITTIPEMTDGESAEESDLESDNGLTALLRDEYLNSFIMPDPSSTATSLVTPNPTSETIEIEPSLSIPSPPVKDKNTMSPNPASNIPLPPTPASTLAVLDDASPTSPPGDHSLNKEAWKRTVIPRQYEQLQGIYPTPLSSLAPTSHEDDEGGLGLKLSTEQSPKVDNNISDGRQVESEMDKFHWMPPKTPPLSIRRHSKSHLPPTPTPTLTLSNLNSTTSPIKQALEKHNHMPKKQDEKKLREWKIFLTREAGSWHRIAHRLLSGKWGQMKDEILNRVVDELNWVGMIELKEELIDTLDDRSSSDMTSAAAPPVSLGGMISDRITSSPQSTSTVTLPNTSMSAGFIGFTPLSGNSPNSYATSALGNPDGNGRKITRSSSSTSLMMLRSRGNRVSGVNRGGSGYI